MPSLISTTTDYFEGIKVVKIKGMITEISGEQLNGLLNSVVEKENLIIDLSKVELITLGGLKYLLDISMHARSEGTRAVILFPGEETRSLAETADIYHLLIFSESLEEAVTKIRHYT